MGEGAGRHIPWSEVPGPFRFGFVREPALWYRSHWVHKKRRQDYPDPIFDFDEAVRTSTDFADFVRSVTPAVPHYVTDLYEYFLGPAGAIDYIGRQETLVEDLITALDLAGVEFDPALLEAVPPMNEGTKGMPEITPELRELIVASEQEAYERYGYSGDGT